MVKLLGCIVVGFVLLGSVTGAIGQTAEEIEEFLYAALNGDLVKVKDLVANGMDVDVKAPQGLYFKPGTTALHVAANRNHLDMVNFLLGKGAFVNPTNANRWIPLHMAAERGHAAVVKALSNAPFGLLGLSMKNAEGRTPLHLAAVSDGGTVTAMLEAGAHVYTKDNEGRTPLQYGKSKSGAKGIVVLEDYIARMPYNFIVEATSLGDLDWMERLLNNGIDVDVKLQDGDKGDQVTTLTKGITALHIAAVLNKWAVGDFLLAPAKHLVNSRKANPNIADDDDNTPLHRAAKAGHARMVTLLLEAGANVKATENNGKTPQQLAQANGHTGVANDLADFVQRLPQKLRDAVSAGNTFLIKRLIKNGADVNRKGGHGETPLHLATRKDTHVTATINALLTATNIDMEAKDDTGNTPLHFAATFGRITAATALLEGGADVTTTDGALTALHKAALHGGGAPVVRLLLDYGADVNRRDNNNNQTALHFAADKGRTAMVKTLLNNGADVTLVNTAGNTALHLAAGYGEAKVVQLLLDHGADVDAKNNWGQIPQDVALEKGHTDIAPLLGDYVPPAPEELQTAIRRGDADEVKRLIRLGVSLNAIPYNGWPPIHAAVANTNPNLEIIHLLLAAGADATLTVWRHFPFDIPDWSALHFAVGWGRGHLEAAELLLAYQGDETLVAYQDSYGNSALHLAAKKGDRAMVELLVAYWPDVLDLGNDAQIDPDNPPDREASIPNNEGKTPRELAQDNGHTEIAEALNGEKAFARNAELHGAIYDSDDPDWVKTILNEGASIETRSNLIANTPLHTAVLSKRTAVAQFLLGKGASTEARNALGDTPLHSAARMANANMTAMLLSAKAEVNVRNIYGRTPLHLATSARAEDVKQKLLDAGADTTIEDWYGNTPL